MNLCLSRMNSHRFWTWFAICGQFVVNTYLLNGIGYGNKNFSTMDFLPWAVHFKPCGNVALCYFPQTCDILDIWYVRSILLRSNLPMGTLGRWVKYFLSWLCWWSCNYLSFFVCVLNNRRSDTGKSTLKLNLNDTPKSQQHQHGNGHRGILEH